MLIAQPEMRRLAALAAFSLHVGFTAALTGDQPGSEVRRAVTESSVQRAHGVTVTGCRNRAFSQLNQNHRSNFANRACLGVRL